MDSETKVIHHGTTVVDESGSNPPAYGSPAPGPGKQGPPQVIHTTTAPIYVMARQVGPTSSSMICQSCHAEITTRIELKASTKTHLIAVGICLSFCWCLLCLPYLMDSCKNVNHYCPNCGSYIGVYKG